ncbi:MAG TPA: GNAT family N-acetyltransferase, partial [Candidatus Tumulicola sp.]
MRVRPFDATRDSYDALTLLLHSAYRRLADMGLNYVATTQDASVTRTRVAAADACWVAEDDGAIVGTVCYYAGLRHDREPAWYARAAVCHFGPFAVLPSLQGGGVGTSLLRAVEERALADGKTELACDTAEPASHLLEYYARRGFRVVGRHRWPHAVYD